MGTEQRIFCDTNYLLDVYDPQRSRHEAAIALLWYAELNAPSVKLLASISSFKDAYYILSRLYRDERHARESIESLMGTYIEPVDMRAAYGPEALSSNEPDFEDGLIRACAEHENARVIITADERAFEHSPIPSMSASAFLERQGFDFSTIAL